jgi:energy-coupling factor transport system ATP-binding protein
VIEAEKLQFSYNAGTVAEIKALAGIDAFIRHGEFVAVIGHNGCGKSTLAKQMNALLIPTEGDVRVDGLNTRDTGSLWDIRKACGMVFQNPDNQLVATVVEEDAAFGPENLGVDPAEIRQRVDEALRAVGIGGMEKRSSHLLSGGQKQRLAIAGIIAMHPRYIILDESTSMLDASGRKEVLATVRKLNRQEGIGVVFITHSMEEALEADRIIVMEKGRVVMEGSPREVFTHVERLREMGLGVPPMVELAHILREMGVPVPPGVSGVEEMAGFLLSVMPAGGGETV